ncbi:NAD(P)-dependent glycerol-3-phosphate dehydrogenase [Rhodospirillaceae bacterium KN72]|uniref:Glycerol-3-phosphate dehydrogenase [NAD(P)+] n=1 Tax=Pacificispira spongiicola TaxID=2729598 RepID=A0A7Y0DY62_9PROT|nr:NAD(P)H-dependent glycerol-3-phosphate dehydrogenase [Pacificispira spongiicola]NMM43769.1 NAD(P)-dependent glycerol-3-phosphate dehydrogenase [Pacificispira spongiicola]
MSGKTHSVAVLGGGAWGTALACAARRAGSDVRLWARNPDVAAGISGGSNPTRLPGVTLSSGIDASTELDAVLPGADCVLLAVPAQAVRGIMENAAPLLSDGVAVAICAKGVERGTLKLMTDVVAETAPAARIGVLSGPTFAGEVARGLPTAVVIAAPDEEAAKTIQSAVGSGSFRAYLSDDTVGAEVGGAVKNVVALAAGIATGRGLGENARAALVSRGLAEMIRLAVTLGGRAETVMGLAGAGDLILTAMSETSRNTSFGMALGSGRSARETLAARKAVTEGYWSAQAVAALAERHGVDMPIAQAVNAILSEKLDIDSAIGALLDRPVSAEFRM